jgi:hypothetical protein
MGEIQIACIDLSTVKTDSPVDLTSMAKFKTCIADVDAATLETMGCDVHTATFAKGQLLYIPAGYYVFEVCTKGPLCFGIRKSIFINNVTSSESYGRVVKMTEADGREVTRMKVVLEKFG